MPELTAADEAWAAFTDHWAGCDWCQEGLACSVGDPMWATARALTAIEEEACDA